MEQKVRNKRNGQLFAPTRILMDNINAGHKNLELVSYREAMKQYASDEEYNAFLAGGEVAPKVSKQREALQVPKVEIQSEPEQKQEESPKDEAKDDPLAALRESLKKKPRKALIKEAESAKIKVDPAQSDDSIIDAICELYRN